MAGRGQAGQGEAGEARHGVAGRGRAWPGGAWLGAAGWARRGTAGQGKAWRGVAGEAITCVLQLVAHFLLFFPHRRRKVCTMAKAKKDEGGTIQLRRLKDAVIRIPIVGLTPVIPHRWSEKAKRMMPGHPDAPDVKETKGARKPEEEAEACLYRLGTKIALPATGFKAAVVGACRFFEKPSMVEAKQLIFIEGEGPEQLVEIKGRKELREDMPRNANGNADLRYRYYIHDWTTTISVRYVPSRITRESVIALVDAAGRGGVCDWRPSAPKSYTGTYGTFRVDQQKEVKDVQ